MLIADHEWLLNLSKIFKGKKYIIRVRPSSSGEGSEDPTVDSIAVVKDKVLKLSEKVQSTINKRLDSVDVNTRFLIGYQQKSVEKVINKLESLKETNINESVLRTVLSTQKLVKELSEDAN